MTDTREDVQRHAAAMVLARADAVRDRVALEVAAGRALGDTERVNRALDFRKRWDGLVGLARLAEQLPRG